MPKTGDLASLYPRNGARIQAFLRRLAQDDAAAEDLTQETFLRAAEHFDGFRGEGTVANWLYRIATNVFRDHLRRRGSADLPLWDAADGAGETGAAEIPDAGPGVPQIVERREVTRCVRGCIGALPAPYRAVLVLFAVEGKTIRESAEILGCSTGAVKIRLHRARDLFKRHAAEHCDVSTEEPGGGVSCLPKRRARKHATRPPSGP